MATLLYAPAAKVAISTASNGVIDVTDDVTRIQVTLTENAPSSVQFSLANHRRKYDRVFTPNDRVVVQLRRIGPFLQSFSGYLNQVPYFTVYPRTVNLSATDTLKRIMYHPWDPGSQASFELLHQGPDNGDTLTDSGVKDMLVKLLTDVIGWPSEQIHIGEVPADWFDKMADLYMAVATSSQPPGLVGGSSAAPSIAGINYGAKGQGTTIPGIGPGTGQIPDNGTGRCSWFGGPGGGAYGNMALTGEPGGGPIGTAEGPRDQWYCAMRWQYIQWVNNPTYPTRHYLPIDQENAARQWWIDRRVLVTNPKNGRSVVLRAADWGPYSGLDRVIDMSQYALETVLQGSTNDTMNITFAPDGAPLGPYSILAQADAAASPLGSTTSADYSIPSDIGIAVKGEAFSWGGFSNGRIPDSSLVDVGDGKKLAPIAGPSFQEMQDAAAKDGVSLLMTSAYLSYDEQASVGESPGESNHGWGMAVELSVPGGTTDPAYQWLRTNAHRFGWANSTAVTHTSSGADAIIAEAQQWVTEQVPYVFGGTTKKGADCSGFVQAVFGAHGVQLGRTTQDQYKQGVNVPLGTGDPLANALPGDVIFFGMNNEGLDHQHEGIYIGGGQMINEPNSGSHARIDNVIGWDSHEPLAGIRRFLSSNVVTAQVLTEPWHWEFWAALNDTNRKLLGIDSGGPPSGSATDGPTTPFNVFQWTGGVGVESELLGGARALMNDEPALNYVQMLANISMRSFMAAPNGDFISWFPDYFGLYGLAGKMDIQEVELQDFTMVWDDSRLITHQYVAGAPTGNVGDDPNGVVDIVQKYGTAGIVSVEQPQVMQALFRLDPSPGHFGNADATLKRFGARPNFTSMGTITGSEAEFWYALFLFQRNWAEQFSTSVPLTFMPELFPGMLMQIRGLNFQAYVTQVMHTIDFTDGVGFSTQAIVIAPSALSGGLFMPPGAI